MLTIQEMKFHGAEPRPSTKQLQDLLFFIARVAYFNAKEWK